MNRIYIILLLLAPIFSMGQHRLTIAFYNQENLFDTIDDPHKNDNEFLPTSKNGWNTERYLNKLDHMSAVIRSMNDGQGPDIIGLCEVENRAVLEDLVRTTNLKKCNLQVVHAESPDERSIDNALLFRNKQFQLVAQASYAVTIDSLPNFKTRDILLVKLMNRKQATLTVLVNHFPSRLGGQEASEPKRIRAAQVLRHIFDSIRQADPKQVIIAMGDFNDEPTDKSIDSVLQAKADTTGITLYNAMLPLKIQGKGSLTYRGNWNMLDQMIMTPIVFDPASAYRYVSGSATVYQQPWMVETEEKYKGSPKRTFAGSKYLNGYSDHFPVTIQLIEK